MIALKTTAMLQKLTISLNRSALNINLYVNKSKTPNKFKLKRQTLVLSLETQNQVVAFLLLFVGYLTSQQHASVSRTDLQGQFYVLPH